MDGLPFSQACENNKAPILDLLETVFNQHRRVLEIGSGTGQHAVHFSRHMPHLSWQPTELPGHLEHTLPRVNAYGGSNLLQPIAFDVRQLPWQVDHCDAVFTANTLHIMALSAVEALFRGLGDWATPPTTLAVYGPFNYGGRYTSDSNARFDQWLAERDPVSAIRDFEAVDALASSAGFSLQQDVAMPANNRLVIWRHG